MGTQQQKPTPDPGAREDARRQSEGQGQSAARQDQDTSQGSETLDDALQEDQRDHSDNGRGHRGVLNR
jgi:hypothetical protein